MTKTHRKSKTDMIIAWGMFLGGGTLIGVILAEVHRMRFRYYSRPR